MKNGPDGPFAPHAFGVLHAPHFARGVQKHHDQLAARHLGLHDEATAGFGDVARLLKADVPRRVLDQAIRVVVVQRATTEVDLVTGRRGQIAQDGALVGHGHQGREIARARLVGAGQAGGLDVTGVRHAQFQRLLVHQAHELSKTARVGATECMGGPVFAGHQRQVHQLATAERGAHGQARTAALVGVHVVLRDGDHFLHVQVGVCHHQAGHELGQRGDRQHGRVVLAEQHFVGFLIDHQGHAGIEFERIVHRTQAQARAFGKTGRHGRAHHRLGGCGFALNGHLVQRGRLARRHLNLHTALGLAGHANGLACRGLRHLGLDLLGGGHRALGSGLGRHRLLGGFRVAGGLGLQGREGKRYPTGNSRNQQNFAKTIDADDHDSTPATGTAQG